ncbi:MAG: TIGR03111 family XrtG-associated glycosyltransferase [bacterium]|jgi:biofilm PGA synthesis N-glycosyltransferase PgaC
MFTEAASRIFEFTLTWGAWLIIPLLVDILTGVFTFGYTFLLSRPDEQTDETTLTFHPPVTLIVPVHDSAFTLTDCLDSILNQSYPSTQLEIVCVDNGSRDESFAVFRQWQEERPGVNARWIELSRAGKAKALNAGICASRGTYIINIDSDARLDRDAVKRMVAAMENAPDLAAATGSIIVAPTTEAANNFLGFLRVCEAAEYQTAFQVGRRYQAKTNTLFTLSGAFSAFRRDVLLRSFLYSERTVSEDTDLTFHLRTFLRGRQGRIGYVSGAIARVKPVSSLSRLYSQRVRWQRGQIEVASLYWPAGGIDPGNSRGRIGRLLLTDHTLSFGRMTWTLLFPLLCCLGYPVLMVFEAIAAFYLSYIFLDALLLTAACRTAGTEARKEMRRKWWIVFILPLYRTLLYWFRIAGIITALTEPANWQTTPPWEQVKTESLKLWRQLMMRQRGGERNEGRAFCINYLHFTRLRRTVAAKAGCQQDRK